MLDRIRVAKGHRIRYGRKGFVKPLFLDRIVFQDEKLFRCKNRGNAQNERVWLPKKYGNKREQARTDKTAAKKLRDSFKQNNPWGDGLRSDEHKGSL